MACYSLKNATIAMTPATCTVAVHVSPEAQGGDGEKLVLQLHPSNWREQVAIAAVLQACAHGLDTGELEAIILFLRNLGVKDCAFQESEGSEAEGGTTDKSTVPAGGEQGVSVASQAADAVTAVMDKAMEVEEKVGEAVETAARVLEVVDQVGTPLVQALAHLDSAMTATAFVADLAGDVVNIMHSLAGSMPIVGGIASALKGVYDLYKVRVVVVRCLCAVMCVRVCV